jgi:septum formation protein
MNQHNLQPSIYLASRSPRRAELLQQIGLEFRILPSDIDESVLANELPEIYVKRLAHSKAEVGLAHMIKMNLTRLPILAADTTVAVDGVILGKPEDDADAYAMLQNLSGRWHEVHTALAVAFDGKIEVALSTTRVELAQLEDSRVKAYIASGEPRDKAGAYGIQGLAGAFIKHIEGSYSGVMGLPIYETAQLLRNAGVYVL